MPGPLRLHPGQPRLLPAVLPVVQPGASPFRHRLSDPGHGALRAIPDRVGPPPGGARCRLPGAPGPLRSTATQAVALAGGGLDQQTTSTGQNDRGRKSVNSHAVCLNIIHTRRTVRNRTRRVGGRLLREQAKPAGSARPTPSKTLVIGLDEGFVKSNRPLSERNFEVTAGKVLGEDGECTRFAFATNEYEHGLRQIRHALEELRVDEKTQITVLSDGDAGLRTVQWEVAPGSEHILDSLPYRYAL